MSTYIYTTVTTLDDEYSDCESIASIGFYPSATPSVMASINWCESDIDEATYAPIITDIGAIETSFEIGSPVVQASQVSLSVANHDKLFLQLQSLGISLIGQNIEVILNEFNSSGVLISSAVKFNGYITNLSFVETELNLTCESNKYNRKSNVLISGQVLSVGESSADIHFALSKHDSTAAPAKEIITFSNTQSFLLLGYDWTVGTANANMVCQIFFPFDPELDTVSFAKIVGSWLYIAGSSTVSKGQYRKILTITEVTRADLSTTYKANFPAVGYYYEVEVQGAYATDMDVKITTSLADVDMITYVQFVKLNFLYYFSKVPFGGTVDDLFIVEDGICHAIHRALTGSTYWDVNYSQLETGSDYIKIDPEFVNDENTVVTYTVQPCSGLDFVTDDTLYKWQTIATDGTKLFGRMFELQRWKDGIYKDAATTMVGSDPANVEDVGNMSDRILDFDTAHTAVVFQMNYKSTAPFLFAVEFTPPAIADDFTFKSVYLGVVLESKCISYLIDPGVKVMTREIYGNAKEVATIPLKQWLDSGATPALISTIPRQYFTAYTPIDIVMCTDWQHEVLKVLDGSEDAYTRRYTNCANLKLSVDTVESYRAIDKIGLFFSRDLNGDYFDDFVTVHELCLIFEHENDVSEVFL